MKKNRRIILYTILIILLGDVVPYQLIPAQNKLPRTLYANPGNTRPTAYQPKTYKWRVLMFGNSSLNAFYLSDEDTIASYLQKELPDALVINLGISGANISAEYLSLLETSLQENDLIIFYDGAEAANAKEDAPFYCGLPIGIVALICVHTPPAFSSQKADEIIRDSMRAIQKSEDLVRRKHGVFLHVIQPVCIRRDNPFDLPMAITVEKLVGADRDIIDLSRMLDCYNDYFFDATHTRPLANRMIADRLYQAIVSEF